MGGQLEVTKICPCWSFNIINSKITAFWKNIQRDGSNSIVHRNSGFLTNKGKETEYNPQSQVKVSLEPKERALCEEKEIDRDLYQLLFDIYNLWR